MLRKYLILIIYIFVIVGCSKNPFLTEISLKAKIPATQTSEVSESESLKEDLQKIVTILVDPSPESGELSQRIYNVEMNDVKPTITLQKSEIVHGNFKLSSASEGAIAHSFNDEVAPDDYIAIISKSGQFAHENHSLNIDSQGNFDVRVLDDQDVWLVTNPKGQFQKAPSFYMIHSENQQRDFNSAAQIIESNDYYIVNGALKINELRKVFNETSWQISMYQSGILVSSVISPNGDGDFSLKLARVLPYDPRKVPVELHVRFLGTEACMPNITKKVVINDPKNIKLGTISIVDTDTLSLFRISVEKENNESQGNVPIYIAGIIDGEECVLETITDDNGKIDLYVLAGEYQIAAVPSFVGNLGGRYKERSIVKATDEKITFHLKEMPRVQGMLYDNSGNPVFGANIQFREISSKVARLVERVTGKELIRTEAQTNEAGQWCAKRPMNHTSCGPVYLDDQRYEIMVVPPAGTALPYFVTDFAYDGVQQLEVRLPEPVLIEGKVVNFSGESPVSGAYISIYSIREGMNGFARPFGFAFTNIAGEFSAYVAPTMFAR